MPHLSFPRLALWAAGCSVICAASLGTVSLIGGGAATAASHPVVATTTTVFVSATHPFTNSGVAVTQGETISMSATGEAAYNGPTHEYGPDGVALNGEVNNGTGTCLLAQYTSVPKWTAPGLPCLSLIAYFTEGTNHVTFFVGKDDTLVAPVSGELILGFNDQYYGDNSKGYTVTITVS